MQFDLLNLSGLPERGVAIAPVAWYEGLQLLPQHFQSGDARLDALLQRHMLSANPYAWGIDRLKIDVQALERGILRVLVVAGCFPDGLTFEWNSLRDGVLECALEAGTTSFRYALAVPSEDFNENGANVGRQTQFVAQPLADRTNRDEKAAIVRLMPNLSIRRWDALNPLYVQIPLLEVVNTAHGFAAADFHPAAVRLIPDSVCTREVADLIRLLRAKAAQLSVSPVPSLLTAEYRSGLNWVLSCLVAGLPRLEAQLASTVTHPYDLFLSLCTTAGAVAPLVGRVPDYFPAYNHADPGASISVVARFISAVVNPLGMSPSRWSEIPFAYADGEWACQIPAYQIPNELLVLVVVGRDAAESVVSSWLQHALICFSDEKGRCREARVRGLARSLSMSVVDLEAAPGEYYIRIDIRDDLGVAERQLVITAPDARSGIVLERVSLMTLSA